MGDYRMRQVPSQEEARSIVKAYLPLVRARARSYLAGNRQHVQLDDLIEVGFSGLLRAIWGFDEKRGIQFGTYATWWCGMKCSLGFAINVGLCTPRDCAKISSSRRRPRSLTPPANAPLETDLPCCGSPAR